jgi:hypothetical protein
VAQWQLVCGWSEGARERPAPPSADKYQRLQRYIDTCLRHWQASLVLLHEPGFHWVLPALQTSQPMPWALHCHAVGDPLQHEELRRRGTLPAAQLWLDCAAGPLDQAAAAPVIGVVALVCAQPAVLCDDAAWRLCRAIK